MSGFTHFDDRGRSRMVDVSDKPETRRTAKARCAVTMADSTLELVQLRRAGKGDVIEVARLAGIMGAKQTAGLIPLCHPLPITSVEIEFEAAEEPTRIEIESSVSTTARTGVEMEAMTAVTVAALTIYDMVKSVDRAVEIEDVRLVFKDGGKSGRFTGRR